MPDVLFDFGIKIVDRNIRVYLFSHPGQLLIRRKIMMRSGTLLCLQCSLGYVFACHCLWCIRPTSEPLNHIHYTAVVLQLDPQTGASALKEKHCAVIIVITPEDMNTVVS